MKEYWSCSKFADWLRGTPKLLAGTSEEWSAWEKKPKDPWLSKVDLSKVNLGSGEGGDYHSKYQLSLPKIAEESVGHSRGYLKELI